jgi:hypothetical protein
VAGSIRRRRKSSPNQATWQWLPNRQPGRHLSWQPPERLPPKFEYHYSQTSRTTAFGHKLWYPHTPPTSTPPPT